MRFCRNEPLVFINILLKRNRRFLGGKKKVKPSLNCKVKILFLIKMGRRLCFNCVSKIGHCCIQNLISTYSELICKSE